MPAPIGFPFSFRNVAVASRRKAFLVGGNDEGDSQELSVSFVFKWEGAWSSKSFRGDVIDLCVPIDGAPGVLMLDANGVTHRWTSSGVSVEPIDSGPDGPDTIGPMREIRMIDGRPYAVGMGRTVYRCDAPRHWTRIDQGARMEDMDWDEEQDDLHDLDLEGFNSIDGFGEDEIYAVGWNGALWRFDGKVWTKIDISTNVSLQTVLCAPNGNAYAAGQLGTILEGRGQEWRIVGEEGSGPDYWDAAWFSEELYLASPGELHVLRSGVLGPVDIGLPRREDQSPFSLTAVDAFDGVIWAVGPKTAIYSIDGREWRETGYE